MIFKKVVAKTGTFTDGNGRSLTLSASFFDQLAASYSRLGVENRAPAVVGHPQDNSPAFGWVTALERAGQELVATVEATSIDFLAAVKNKIYPRVSISLFDEAHPANPTPGEKSLRHIGFLGGAAPAIPNLPLANLAAAGPCFLLEFTPEEKEEIKPMSEVIPTDFAAEKAKLEKQTADLAAREVTLAAAEKVAAEKVASDRAAAVKAKVEGWKTDGKLPPAFAASVEGILVTLASPADFSAETGQTVSDQLIELFDGLQKSGLFEAMERKGKKDNDQMTPRQRGAMISAKRREMGGSTSLMDAESALMAEGKISEENDDE